MVHECMPWDGHPPCCWASIMVMGVTSGIPVIAGCYLDKGWFMCLEAGHDNQSSGNVREHEETSELSDPDRVNILTLTLDDKFKVVGLVRSPRSQRTALTTLTEPVVCGALLFRKLHQAFPLLMILTAC